MPVRSASIAVLSLNLPSRFGRRGARRHDHRPGELLAVVDRRAARTARVDEGGDPHVAEGLLGARPGRRSSRSRRTAVPRRPRPAPGRPALAVRTCARAAYGEVSPGIAGHQRGLERRAAVLGPVVAQPDRPGRRSGRRPRPRRRCRRRSSRSSCRRSPACSRGSTATDGSFCRPRDREHSANVLSFATGAPGWFRL